eukprot:scaffold44657_cov71-Phaeocystis_antarctica.AAC.1
MRAGQAAAEQTARIARISPRLELVEHLEVRPCREGAQPGCAVLAGSVCRHRSALCKRRTARTLEAAKVRVVTARSGGALPILLAASGDERHEEQQQRRDRLHVSPPLARCLPATQGAMRR